MSAPRGYSLPMVILLLSILATAIAAAVSIGSASAASTGAMINRRQAFYACDGVGRAAMVKAREYMRTDTTPTTTEMMTAVCGGTVCTLAAKAALAPSGFTIDTLTLTTTGSSNVLPLPNGPFKGMNARQTDVTITVEATKNATNARCRVSENVTLGEIALFQFFVFSDGYMDLYNGPIMDISGRTHVNGDFTVSNCTAAVTFDRITASGRIRQSGTGSGKYRQCSGTNVSIKDATSTYRTLASTGESGCTTCTPTPGTGSWRAYALARWGGNVQDVDHSVPTLRLPFVGSVAVQDGLDASGNGIDNSTRMRAIVDPPRSTDSAGILAQKLAFKADLRIIDGVWYKKDTGNPSNWPGIPIWSDHPGNYSTPAISYEGILPTSLAAGQAQLSVAHSWASTPKLYSYYRYIPASETIDDPAAGGSPWTPVISYGTLFRTAGGAYNPGFHRGTTASPAFCTAGAATVADARTTTCAESPNSIQGRAANYIEATRGGFQDFRMREFLAGADLNKHFILPMNFDVAAFANALTNTASGELGSHFTPSTFNGIVYIGNLWAHAMDNFSTSSAASSASLAALWPTNQGNDQVAQLPATSRANAENRRLPYNLCSDNLAGNSLSGIGSVGSTKLFRIPSCAKTGADLGDNDDVTTRPNAVRIFNGATINPTTFPKGLSIVTNGPIYLLGDTNTSSAGQTRMSLGGNWRPVMIAGDAITFLSKEWNDNGTDWSAGSTFGTGPRAKCQGCAVTTTSYRVAAIAGNVETSSSAWGGGINNFPRFMERWSNSAGGGGTEHVAKIDGSFVIAYRSVYARQPWDTDGAGVDVYYPPNRNWDYDTNLDLPADQPPGTPTFLVQAIQQWQRD